jgi:hypothetical protein
MVGGSDQALNHRAMKVWHRLVLPSMAARPRWQRMVKILEFVAGQDTEIVKEAYPERAKLYHLRLEPGPAKSYVVQE